MERCPRCGAELSDAERFCPACLISLAAAATADAAGGAPPLPEPPREVGPYRLLERLGEGGMGIVYLAEQREPLRRRVAVKLLRRELASGEVLARFEVERRVLALLRHPGIAQVLDAGTSPEGQPYLVMEHVSGLPITEYCDRNRLDLAQRIELLVQVCEAVQHAHQRGVVHRDLKPSNLLVCEEGGRRIPKVIDFGIAKALEPLVGGGSLFTARGALLGTPEYMSPEQADPSPLDVDTRSDIYSLGVVLYELLTGALPFDPGRIRRAGLAELLRILREEEPQRPSQRVASGGAAASIAAERRRLDAERLVRALRGDLDWIVLRTLEKERGRRYASASELAADLRRHLEHQPVTAAPPGIAYRSRKFARRHRLAIAAGAVAAASLVGFSALSALHSARVTLERDRAVVAERRARGEREAAERAIAFLVDLIESGTARQDPAGPGAIPTILRQAEARIRVLDGRPALQARAYRTMGNVCRRTHRYLLARRALTSAVEIYRGTGERGLDLADALLELGEVADALGDPSGALRAFEEGLELRHVELGEEHPDVAEAERLLGSALGRRGEASAALARLEHAAASQTRSLPEEDPRRLDSTLALAAALAPVDADRAAELAGAAGLAGARAFAGDPLRLAAHWFRVAAVESAAGRADRAEESEARARGLALAGSSSLDHAAELAADSRRLADGGAFAAAAARLRSAVGIRQLHSGEGDPALLADLATLAGLYVAAGDAEGAVDTAARAVRSGASPADLALDPRLVPLVGDDRFRALLAGDGSGLD